VTETPVSEPPPAAEASEEVATIDPNLVGESASEEPLAAAPSAEP
jgi:hypothetical protein